MNEEQKQEKLGAFPYVIGGLSFIPMLGVLFGVIAIIWGLVTKKLGGKKLAIVGACGIAKGKGLGWLQNNVAKGRTNFNL
jgi:hypothetical protein